MLSELRVTLWQEQQDGGNGGTIQAAAAPSAISTRDMATRFALYHDMPAAPNRDPLPSSPADLAKLLDFHQALGALAAASVLAARAGPGPAGRACAGRAVSPITRGRQLPDAGRDRGGAGLVPGRDAPGPGVGSRRRTSAATAVFAAAPATAPGAAQTGDFAQGDVVGGFLVLDPQYFGLAGVDIDGALLKAMGLADSIAYASLTNTAVEQVLPALRSGGISLIASQRGEQLLQAIRDNESFEAVV